MIDYLYIFQAARPQVFEICITILTGYDLGCSSIPKVAKVSNLKYLLREECPDTEVFVVLIFPYPN